MAPLGAFHFFFNTFQVLRNSAHIFCFITTVFTAAQVAHIDYRLLQQFSCILALLSSSIIVTGCYLQLCGIRNTLFVDPRSFCHQPPSPGFPALHRTISRPTPHRFARSLRQQIRIALRYRIVSSTAEFGSHLDELRPCCCMPPSSVPSPHHFLCIVTNPHSNCAFLPPMEPSSLALSNSVFERRNRMGRGCASRCSSSCHSVGDWGGEERLSHISLILASFPFAFFAS